jgi:hypothetical protein
MQQVGMRNRQSWAILTSGRECSAATRVDQEVEETHAPFDDEASKAVRDLVSRTRVAKPTMELERFADREVCEGFAELAFLALESEIERFIGAFRKIEDLDQSRIEGRTQPSVRR